MQSFPHEHAAGIMGQAWRAFSNRLTLASVIKNGAARERKFELSDPSVGGLGGVS